MTTIAVRYEVRYIIGRDDEMLPTATVITCARRGEAYDMARELARDPANRMIEAWQIGADGGDPAIATGLVWSQGLVDAGLAEAP